MAKQSRKERKPGARPGKGPGANTGTTPGAKPAGRRRLRARRRGSLPLIAGLLLTSAVLRIGLHGSEVMALDSGPESHEDATDMAQAEGGATCTPDPDVAAMLEAFDAREARLAQREAQIRDRMNALAIADEEIEKKLAQLSEAEEALRQTLALADSAAENDINRLVAVYENMKPKDAAALFEQMDPEFSAGFLGRMQPAAAAAVMAGLSPDRAYTVSVILAGRNSSVPKN